MIGFLLLALLQQPTSSPDVALQFGLRVFQGERVMSSVTTGQNETVSGSVWADSTLCGVGGGSNASSGPDRIRWQYRGRIVQRTSSNYTVEIDWQRDGGSFSSAPRDDAAVRVADWCTASARHADPTVHERMRRDVGAF